MSTTTQTIDFKRIDNDVNGNPRYVCHFFNLLTEKEISSPLGNLYVLALKRAHKIGGRRFHNTQYGGGIVFQSYNIAETEKQIKDLLK